MCLATPVRLEKVEGVWGTVLTGKTKKKINISLLKNAKKGDWILAHADLAVNTLPAKEAKEILKLIEESSCSCHI